MLQAAPLAALTWLRHGFSTRPGGVSTIYGQYDDLNLGFTKEDDRANVEENRRTFLQSIAPGNSWPLRTTRQIHSDLTLPLATPEAPLDPADGLSTALPGVFLAMLTADCVPVLIADPVHRAVAVFHAGWRGTVAAIVEQGVQHLCDTYASAPEDLLAAIGPSIGPCCYEVGEEVRTRFDASFPYAADLFHDSHLDLWQSNRHQLESAGLPSTNITVLAQCTACARTPNGRRNFFSYRTEQGLTGRMMTAIAIVPSGTVPTDTAPSATMT
jgi:YfiH family protein